MYTRGLKKVINIYIFRRNDAYLYDIKLPVGGVCVCVCVGGCQSTVKISVIQPLRPEIESHKASKITTPKGAPE